MPAKSSKSKGAPKAPKAPRKKAKEEDVPSFKVTTHFLIPKHELLVHAEAGGVLKEFNANPSQFPYLQVTDPAAKEIGAKPGDFVRIARSGETAGQRVYYSDVEEGQR